MSSMKEGNQQAHSQSKYGRKPIDERELRLFRSLDVDRSGGVSIADLLGSVTGIGLREDDARLRETFAALSGFGLQDDLPVERFCDVIRPNILLMEQALQGNVAIPDFAQFSAEIDRIYDRTKAVTDGEVASYIPQLAKVSPDRYGVALCTVDGQRHAAGDAREDFSVQSCFKPITYSMALEEHGAEFVHRHVGREPSGLNFNELALGEDGEPHNPMINAGAIMCTSMIRPGLQLAERFEYVLDVWARLCGSRRPRFNNAVYQSEKETADRNYALGYYMREHKAFPEGTDMLQALEFYFQSCAMELDADSMSVLAATLANGGVCPTTGERVFRTDTVQNCLSLMVSCGMYDFSGEFAFSVGLPAKSGVGGGMIVVVPNLMGLCIWSPRLDARGNPVRGIAFCNELVAKFNLHNYDNLTGVSEKSDPRVSQAEQKAKVGTGSSGRRARGITVQPTASSFVDSNRMPPTTISGRRCIWRRPRAGNRSCATWWRTERRSIRVTDGTPRPWTTPTVTGIDPSPSSSRATGPRAGKGRNARRPSRPMLPGRHLSPRESRRWWWNSSMPPATATCRPFVVSSPVGRIWVRATTIAGHPSTWRRPRVMRRWSNSS